MLSIILNIWLYMIWIYSYLSVDIYIFAYSEFNNFKQVYFYWFGYVQYISKSVKINRTSLIFTDFDMLFESYGLNPLYTNKCLQKTVSILFSLLRFSGLN